MARTFFFHYFAWHYSRAIVDIAGIVLNFRWFFHEFFGVSYHLQTFFVPFQRLKETATHALDLEDIATSFIVTTLMRLVGMVFRTVAIVCGIFLQLVTFVFGGLMLLVWLFVPLLLLVLFGSGVVLLLHV